MCIRDRSWEYDSDKLVRTYSKGESLSDVVVKFKKIAAKEVGKLKGIEEDNARIIKERLSLVNEISDIVNLSDITLFNNPLSKSSKKAEANGLWEGEVVEDLVSYSVGCMFGRYSIDKGGLILANQGSTLANYYAQIPNPRFVPDSDNCIPIFDEDWFADDIVTRFREFVRVTFGEEHYAENMAFIEKTLNVKNKKGWTIRDYFAKDFYEDHVKRYRKRPIYWLFTSPKGSFKCLIYLHRYNRSTVGVVLNSYLRNFMQKLQTFIELADKTMDNSQATAREQSAALKNKAKFSKMLDELRAYERDVLYPLAQESIELDLDDGVKVNYLKFGSALKKIPGLAGKDE